MNFKKLKEDFSDGQVITFKIAGIVDKVYPPANITDNDIKWKRQRQAILIADEDGNKIMVELQKQQLHITKENIEGKFFVVAPGMQDENGRTGVQFSSYQAPGKQYPNQKVLVFPEATIRVLDNEEAQRIVDDHNARKATPPDRNKSDRPEKSQQNAQERELSEFKKTLDLCAIGYRMCLDKAKLVVGSLPELSGDRVAFGEHVRTIATTLWMDVKHLRGSLKAHDAEPSREEPKETSHSVDNRKEQPSAPSPSNGKIKALSDAELIVKVINGNRIYKDSDQAIRAAVDACNEECDRRSLWESVYDEMVRSFDLDAFNKTLDKNYAIEGRIAFGQIADAVYDGFSKNTGRKSPAVERIFCTDPDSWIERIREELSA